MNPERKPTTSAHPKPTLQLRVYLAGVLIGEGEVDGPLVTMPPKPKKGLK